MKWLRYCIALLSFMILSPSSFAEIDPVGWSMSGTIPPTSVVNLHYGPVTYTFTNNLPYKLTCPLYILITAVGPFNIFDNTCAGGRALDPGESCHVTFDFQPTVPGNFSISLAMSYGKNVVPLPALSTITSQAPPPLVTGVVTTPLPANMGAGEQKTFRFTYTNMNNGTVTSLFSPSPTVSVNAGGGSIISTNNNCASFTELLPGQSCFVEGVFQAGVQGNYTISHTLSYFGGSTTLSTSTFATMNIVGQVTTGFPSPMGAGEENTLTFTFTNSGTDTVYGTPNISATLASYEAGTGGTASISGTNCNTATLGAGDSCTVDVLFSSGLPSPPSYFATVDFSYAGGSHVATTTAGPTNGVILIQSAVIQDFPSNIGTGEYHDVIFQFTNNGSGVAYNVTTPEANFNPVGGTCVSTATSCGTTLNSGDSCTATCTFEATAESTNVVRVTDGFTYAGGTNVAQVSTSTNVTVTNNVDGEVTSPSPFPSQIGVTESLPITFTFTNNGSQPVNGVTAATVTVVPGSPNGTFTVGTDNCAILVGGVLNNGDSCTVTGTFTAEVTGDYTIDAVFNYDGPAVHASLAPLSINAGRVITIENRCNQNVWYSFNGSVTKFGCASDSDCPSGSLCNAAANGGAGACFWRNPEPQTGGLQLGPMIGTTPTTSTVIVPDKGTTLGAIWQGKVAARTGCSGSGTVMSPYVCDTGSCGSNAAYPEGSCDIGRDFVTPSSGFATPITTPITTIPFKLIKTANDQYGIQGSNGLNISLSMGPTTEAWGGVGAPYTCATPGDAGLGAAKSFSACGWTPVLPNSPGDANPRDFVWVKKPAGVETACASNATCLVPGEVCGLRYDGSVTPAFARVCGVQLGYWTGNQVCQLNPTSGDTFFNCNDAITNPNYDLLRNLYSCTPVIGTDLGNCYNAGATTNCCGCINWNATVPGVPPTGTISGDACVNSNLSWDPTVLDTIEWMKTMCPQLITYPDDTGSTRFTCQTADSVAAGTNVAAYTITFCPEVVSNPLKKSIRKS